MTGLHEVRFPDKIAYGATGGPESARRTLRTVLRELARQDYAHVQVDEIVLEVNARMMDRLPEDAIVHVRFEELERDPLGELERAYHSLGLEGYTAARPHIETYLGSVRDYKKSNYTFSRASVARVTERWQPFVTRVGYRPPDFERLAA